MKGLNRAFLIGHLGADPELRTTASGVVRCLVSLATPNAKKVGDTWVETPDWHRVTAFGKDAEYLTTYAHKGDALSLECVIRPSKWADAEGTLHYETALVVERILWLGADVSAEALYAAETGHRFRLRDPGDGQE